jgi:hypothetical protein
MHTQEILHRCTHIQCYLQHSIKCLPFLVYTILTESWDLPITKKQYSVLNGSAQLGYYKAAHRFRRILCRVNDFVEVINHQRQYFYENSCES